MNDEPRWWVREIAAPQMVALEAQSEIRSGPVLGHRRPPP